MSVLKLDTQIPYLDDEHLGVLISLSEDDPKTFINDLFQTFENNWSKVSNDIQKGCEEKNPENLRKAIHLLNGSSANLGLKRLGTLCRGIEASIHDGTFTEYDTCAETVAQEYKNSIQELKAYIASI